MPGVNASTKTVTSGRSRNSARKTTAMAMRRMRTPFRSVVAPVRERISGAASAASTMTKPPSRPCLEQVDRQQQHEGNRQHDGGDGGGAGVVEFLQANDDQ